MKMDVAIVGGGPGGTASALFLAQAGIKSVIIEKDIFPRYHIGESLTGECGYCLRLLGLEEEMKKQQHPVKYGVKVYGPEGKNTFYIPVMARSSEGKLLDSSTWQVRRSDFDNLFLDTAISRGATLLQGQAIAPIFAGDGAVCGVRVRMPNGRVEEVKSKVLIDASGPATFLSNAGVAGQKERGNYDKQIAVFSQVTGAIRGSDKTRDDTLIFYREKNHWAWFIPLDEETVSVGVTVPSAYFRAKGESKSDFLMRELHTLNPELTKRLPEIKLVEEVRAISNYSYHIKEFTGKGYLCVGDSHRFIDPIFSFGVYFSVKEGQYASEAIAAYLASENRAEDNPFTEYQRRCDQGQDVIQDLIDAFWNHPFAFAFFAHSRYVDDFIDMFAGRIYMDKPSRGLTAIRTINTQVS